MYHPVVQTIKNLLNVHSYWYETFEHEPVTTSEEAALVRPGYTLVQGAKAILAKIEKKDKSEEFVLFVMPASLRLDSKKVKRDLNCRSIRFATEEELVQITGGVQRGAVPPFGMLFHIQTIVDQKLLLNEKIVFNAGDRRYSVAMKTVDYMQLVGVGANYSITVE
jgi:prolyl-tRNA editing enzyme YbaK/EbsC (Cys-tRNA(Pro) deacylase)